MKLSLFGRLTMALLASVALGLGMTACGGGTIGYMWVIGQQYNQIAGFKIDDYTGNLTSIPKSPFTTAGSNPVSIVVKTGGRYVYVVNQGVGGSAAGKGVGAGIAQYAVGGDGTLTYQDTFQSQGYVTQWAAMDASGSYLYVLDKYSPTISAGGVYGPNTDGRGAITVFQADNGTGRLSLITNSQTQVNGVNTYFTEVGPTPIMMKSTGACLLTLNSNNTVTPLGIGGSGQLTIETTGTSGQTITGSPISLSSINGNGSYVYLTDTANGGTGATIYPEAIGSGCSLSTVTGGAFAYTGSIFAGITNPVYTMVDNSGKYLYVLNTDNINGGTPVPAALITAFTISTVNGQLQPITGAPYTVGSNPTCMVEDTSNQYIYISNKNDGTVSGKIIDPTTGALSDLTRGSKFNATGAATCLVLSGAVS